jgi:hypothetical protein
VGAACTADRECADGLACATPAGQCVTAQPVGAACADTHACGSGLYCNSQTGTCADSTAMFSAGNGAVCGANAAVYCTDGLYCITDPGQPSYGNGHCTSQRFAASGACRPSIPEACPDGSYCSITTGSSDGACQPLPGDGQPCGASQTCAPGTECVVAGVTGGVDTCHTAAHLGGSCYGDNQCYSQNCTAGVCAAYDPCR